MLQRLRCALRQSLQTLARSCQSVASRIARGHAALARLRTDAAARERVAAAAVFAGIFVFAIGSVDYLITGGPDWNPGAPQIVASQTVERAAATSLRVDAVELPPPQLAPIELAEASGPVGELLGGPEYFEAALFSQAVDRFGDGEPAKPAIATYAAAQLATDDKPKAPTSS